MANGDYLSVNDLNKFSEPLKSIMTRVEGITGGKGLDLSYNVRGWPSILIRWQNAESLNCTLQLYMNADKATFTLWIAVSKDLNLRRHSFSKKLHEGLRPPFDEQLLIQEIQKGIEFCNSVKIDELTLSD